MSRNFLMTVAALLCGVTTASASIARLPTTASLEARSVGIAHSAPGTTDRRSIDDHRGADDAAAPCETFILITQAPASPYAGSTAAITVGFGEKMTPVCLGQDMVDPTSVRFTVNGIDRTSYFTVSSSEASASAVPLVPGTTNTLVATMAGYTSAGAPRTDSDTRVIDVQGSVTYTPAVSPKNQSTAVLATAATQQTFVVRNGGTSASVIYTLAAACEGALTGCTSSQSSVTLAMGDSAVISVGFNGGAAGTTGRVALRATSSPGAEIDSGWMNVSSGATPPVVAITTQETDVVERAMCVTIALPGGAYECGDLRLTHSLPAVTTLGKSRAPVLLYNSAVAVPRPIVSGMVSVSRDVGTPDTVTAIVTVNGVERGRGNWLGNEWTQGGARQIAVPLTAGLLLTGVYAYSMEISAVYGARRYTSTRLGDVAVVNRATSEFGAGWWLAGVERLHLRGDSSIMWVGGDGSVRVYRPDASRASVWRARTVDRPDSLIWDGTDYLRRDLNGVRVKFDGTGRHVATINRLGHVTQFTYTTAGLLASVVVPPATPLPYTYTFLYDAAGTRVTSVQAPSAGPQLNLVALGWQNDKLVSITDPDNGVVRFTIDSAIGPSIGLIIGRTSPAGTPVTYAYDQGSKLASATMPYPVSSLQLAAKTLFGAQESAGAAGGQSKDTATVATEWQSPRYGSYRTTRFVLGAFGAPTRITDPAQQTTLISRDDARFPGLATAIRHPNGRVVQYAYDAHGHADSTTDNGRCADTSAAACPASRLAVTRYEWDHAFDQITLVRQPMGEVASFGYDAGTGNRLWQQTGVDSARRVRFFYDDSLGLLRSVKMPLIANRDTLLYDAVGNVRMSVGKLADTVTYARDLLGRVVETRTIVYQQPAARAMQRYVLLDSAYYDAVGQDTLHVSIAPRDSQADSYPGAGYAAAYNARWLQTWLRVRSVYDLDGNVTAVTRTGLAAWDSTKADTMAVTTQWTYDGLGRKTKEIAPGGASESYFYDGAGQLSGRTTRRGHTIKLTYDLMDRLTTRVTPQVFYPRESYEGETFPHTDRWSSSRFPTGVTIPADTATFSHDAAGNMLTAYNIAAQVERTYNLDGSARTETQRIGTYANSRDFSKHSYAFGYDYDLNGRRTQMSHPFALWNSPAESCASGLPDCGAIRRAEMNGVLLTPDATSTYHYDILGRLDSLHNNLQVWTALRYDALDRPITTLRPNAVTSQRTYDTATGLLAADTTRSPQLYSDTNRNGFLNGLVHGITYPRYDSRGKILIALDRNYSGPEYHALRYTPAGQLARDEQGRHRFADSISFMDRVQFWTFNGLGDRLVGHVYNNGEGWLNDSTSYDRASGRVIRRFQSAPQSGFATAPVAVYDSAGNLHLQGRNITVPKCATSGGDMACLPQYGNALVAEWTANYYSADDRLMLNDRLLGDITLSDGLEEYRYDALGRRVLRRFREDWKEFNNSWDRDGQIQRYVYDGDEALYEIRRNGKDSASAVELERDLSINYATGQFGVVQYLLGPSLDRPLAATRPDHMTVGLGGTMFLHENWNGQFDMGTMWNGERDSTFVDWPSKALTTSLQRHMGLTGGSAGRVTFYGSAVDKQTDGSSAVYMRNRYYDPVTGRFTQEDPIGIAGGLNVYGFAKGDPVQYSDPFGLCTPWPACANAFWDDAAVAGHQEGGISGGAKALGSVIMGTMIEGFGVNKVDKGMDEVVAGNTGKGLALIGLAIVENVPGGKATRALPGVGKGWTKLRGAQGWRDAGGNIWKKDKLHKNHWDVSNKKGKKIAEVDSKTGDHIWPFGPKNKNKT